MKSRQRRSFSAEMKARIALEAIKGQKTIQEIAPHYGVHPTQVATWKRQAVDGVASLFADRRSHPDTSEEALKAERYQQIGQLQVELDWLKKSPACRARTEAGMDWRRRGAEHPPTVSVGGDFAVGLVLPRGARNNRESALDALARRAIHANTVLWCAQDDQMACGTWLPGECETGAPVDATDGVGGDLSQAAAVDSCIRTSYLSLSAGRTKDRAARSRLVQRHHVHPAAAGVCLSGCGHGLVQPVCSGLGSVGVVGDVVLSGSFELGLTVQTARNLQYGSRGPVHQRRVHEPAGGARHRYQHGWTLSSERQHFHRTTVADGEIRRGISEGLPRCAGSDSKLEKLLCLLQSRTFASGARLPDAGGNLLCKKEMCGVKTKMWDAVDRRRSRSSFLGVPKAKFPVTNRKGAQGQEREPVETDAAAGNPPKTRIPTAAWKAQSAFHSSHEAQQRYITQFFKRLRSTLNEPFCGPKNGEPFSGNANLLPETLILDSLVDVKRNPKSGWFFN